MKLKHVALLSILAFTLMSGNSRPVQADTIYEYNFFEPVVPYYYTTVPGPVYYSFFNMPYFYSISNRYTPNWPFYYSVRYIYPVVPYYCANRYYNPARRYYYPSYYQYPYYSYYTYRPIQYLAYNGYYHRNVFYKSHYDHDEYYENRHYYDDNYHGNHFADDAEQHQKVIYIDNRSVEKVIKETKKDLSEKNVKPPVRKSYYEAHNDRKPVNYNPADRIDRNADSHNIHDKKISAMQHSYQANNDATNHYVGRKKLPGQPLNFRGSNQGSLLVKNNNLAVNNVRDSNRQSKPVKNNRNARKSELLARQQQPVRNKREVAARNQMSNRNDTRRNITNNIKPANRNYSIAKNSTKRSNRNSIRNNRNNYDRRVADNWP